MRFAVVLFCIVAAATLKSSIAEEDDENNFEKYVPECKEPCSCRHYYGTVSGNCGDELRFSLFRNYGEKLEYDLKYLFSCPDPERSSLARNIDHLTFKQVDKSVMLQLERCVATPEVVATLEEKIFGPGKKTKYFSLLDYEADSVSNDDVQLFPELTVLKIDNTTAKTISPLSVLKNLEIFYLNDNRNLSALPAGFLAENKKLRKVEIHNYRDYPLSLPDDLFMNLPELEEVKVHVNKKTWPENIFSGSQNLQVIKLDDNEIEELPAKLFAGLSKLRELSLSRNKIKKLYADQFKDLVALENLELSGNEIKELPSNIFATLTSLKTINMGSNKVEKVGESIFPSPNALQHVCFRDNKLGLDSNSLAFLKTSPSLISLGLENNQIPEFSWSFWSKSPSLRYINLRQNNISHVDFNDFPVIPKDNVTVARVVVKGNPIEKPILWNKAEPKRETDENKVLHYTVSIPGQAIYSCYDFEKLPADAQWFVKVEECFLDIDYGVQNEISRDIPYC